MSRAGEQFGKYRLIRRIGSGGTADVYYGEHIEHPSQIAAVKILKTDLDDEIDKKTFQNEVRAYTRLNHPNIIKYLDSNVQETKPYIIMEYASGGNLAQRYPPGQPVPHEQIMQWVLPIAEALQYAHTQGVIHCDLKPQNIFLSADGSVKVGDFGYARILQSTKQHSSGPKGATWEYSAPEQIDRKRFGDTSPLTDQYALGIIVYQWLCGRVPFRDPMPRLIYQHMDEAPLPLRKIVPTITPGVEQVVLKAIAKAPLDRFEGIIPFAQALEKGEVIYPDPGIPEPSQITKTLRRAFMHWKKIAVVMVLLLLGTLVWNLPETHFKLLGGLSLDSYCKSIHLDHVTADLSCAGKPSQKIIMTSACNWQYHRNDLTASTGDYSNPYSWHCYDSQNQYQGDITGMGDYCKSQGYDAASLDGKKTAKDWICTPLPPQTIDMTQACLQRYNRIDVHAREITKGNWQCYGLF